MRGQHLFVRPIEPADADAVTAFLSRNGEPAAVPACGLLGKIVGDVVAVLAFDVAADALRIEQLVVARELRRKRIGRRMLDEAAAIARRLERDQLVVEAPERAAEFLRRTGFAADGGRVVRRTG